MRLLTTFQTGPAPLGRKDNWIHATTAEKVVARKQTVKPGLLLAD
jgi:hypothetical protein